MGRFIDPEDLKPFADIPELKAAAMISDAEAQALLAAPKLKTVTLDADGKAKVKAILRAAILRWNDRGSGMVRQTSQTAGEFSYSQSVDPGRQINFFTQLERDLLKQIAGGDDAAPGGAFMIDLAAGASIPPADPSIWW